MSEHCLGILGQRLLVIVITAAKEDMFSPVSRCLLGDLSARLHKNYKADFHNTWVEFWAPKRSCHPLTLGVNFSGTKAWISI